MIVKPEKNPNDISYRPPNLMIYLLPASGLSPGGSCTIHIYTQTVHRTTQNKQYIEQHKIWEYKNFGTLHFLSEILDKIFLKRLTPSQTKAINTSQQFGFRKQHGTIEQAHRLVYKINNVLESKRYCSAAFIDVSQAFNKYGIQVYSTNSNVLSHTHSIHYWNRTTLTGHFKQDTEKNTLNSTPSNLEYHKAVFSDPRFIQYLQQTYQKPSKHWQQPMPMVQPF